MTASEWKRWYIVEYEVRKVGSIGDFWKLEDQIQAEGEEQARDAFRMKYAEVYEFRSPIATKRIA